MRDRAILDTGTLVSALIYPNRLCGMALRHALANCELVGSSKTLSHFVRTLRDDGFDAWRPIEERSGFAELVVGATTRFEPSQPIAESANRCDEMYLELSVEAGAKYLVTSRADILGLEDFRGTQFVSPSEFLALY